MSSQLASSLIEGITCLALLCCLIDIDQTLRHQKTVLTRPIPPPDESASAICSACHGHLSGLESHCPTCGKRLRYQVPGGSSASRPQPTPYAHKDACSW